MSRQDHYDRVKRAGFLSLKRIMSRSFAIWLSDLQRALQPEPWSKPFNQSRQTALWPIAKGYVPYGAGRGFTGDRCSAWRETARHSDLTTTMQHFCSPRISSVTPDRLRAAICPFISSELSQAFAEGSMGQVVQLNKWALVKYGAFHISKIHHSWLQFYSGARKLQQIGLILIRTIFYVVFWKIEAKVCHFCNAFMCPS